MLQKFSNSGSNRNGARGAAFLPHGTRASSYCGNAGMALLGDNLQVGEVEFVEFKGDPKTPEGANAARRAIDLAFERLQERLGRRLGFYLDPSHPDFRLRIDLSAETWWNER